MNKMERFTQRARDVLNWAQQEAERLQHGTLDTQHLLFGMLVEEGGVAGRVLREIGIQAKSVREKIEQMAPTNTYHSGEPPTLSEGTKRVLELAVEEARRMEHHYMGTEHLLLALARLNEGGAIEILKGMNVTPEQIRHTTRRVLQESPLRPKPPKTEARLPDPPETEGRFTQRGRRALSLAQEEAERLQHNYIGTEHLLLGLIREEGGVAGRVLRELGLDQRRVEELVERMTRATTPKTSAQPELSPGTKRVLELAVDEARRMGHHYIGTEHLLLGLVRLTEGVAIDILKRLGVSPEEVRRQTRRVLQESPLSAKPPETESRPPEPPETQWRSPIPPKGILLSEYNLRVTVRDAETNEQKVEFEVRLDRLNMELYALNGRVFQGKPVDPIEWSSGDNQIVVTVEKAKD